MKSIQPASARHHMLQLVRDYACNDSLPAAASGLTFARPSCFGLLDAFLHLLEYNGQLPTR